MCVLLYSKAAVQDVLHAGKVCLLDIDMQVNEAPKRVLYCLRTCMNIKLLKQINNNKLYLTRVTPSDTNCSPCEALTSRWLLAISPLQYKQVIISFIPNFYMCFQRVVEITFTKTA